MRLFAELWNDESGALLSAELVLLSTIGVLGAIVGLRMVGTAINEELRDVAFAFRSLDQSYAYTGFVSPRSWTAGSAFQQQDVAAALAELVERERDDEGEAAQPEAEPLDDAPLPPAPMPEARRR